MEVREKAPTNKGQPPHPFFFGGVLGLKNLAKYQSSHLYDYLVGDDEHSVENLRTSAALAKSAPLDFPSEKRFSFIFCP